MFFFYMVYFMSYWSHLDISTTICPHQMAAEGFELTTLGFRGMAPYTLHHLRNLAKDKNIVILFTERLIGA